MKKLGTVFAAGARTPLGPDLLSTALLVRAGLPALTSAPLSAGGNNPVTMAFDPTLDPMLLGEERAALLAKGALQDLVAAAGYERVRGLKLKVALAFPEPRPGQPRALVGNVLAKDLRGALFETVGDPQVELEMRGSAGLAYVLPAALAALGRHEVDAVIAGGTHTDYDPAVIAGLLEEGRLFKPSSVDAVIPGETAAFVLIGRPDLGSRLGLSPLLDILGVASDTGDITPHGNGSAFDATTLTSVFRSAASSLPSPLRIGWALGDHGIEHFRVRELYAAVTRAHDIFIEPMDIDSPPQRLGRTGAASLGLFLGLAAEAYRRGYAPAPIGMVFAGSDGGERGAIVVGSP